MAKSILVTGGSRGIGRGICLELAKNGYSVAINYAGNKIAAEECLKLCRGEAQGRDQQFEIFRADISNASETGEMLDLIDSRMGVLAGLVNNAGVAPMVRNDLLEMTEESFDRVLGINLKGCFFLTQAVASRWLAEKQNNADYFPKKIVFISSLSAETASINRGEYCISKAGVSMAVKLFAARLACENIQVFELRPGIVKTDMTAAVKSKYDELILEGLVPQNRWGLPEDVGKAAAAIIGAGFGFSTGSVIPVDGGLGIPRL